MNKIISAFHHAKKQICIIISAVAGLISFFWGHKFPIDPRWIAIILCGVPTIIETVIGLVTSFDIRVDIFVSIELIASVLIGETFAAAEIASHHADQ